MVKRKALVARDLRRGNDKTTKDITIMMAGSVTTTVQVQQIVKFTMATMAIENGNGERMGKQNGITEGLELLLMPQTLHASRRG